MYCGIDIGGTNLKIGLCDESGQLIDSHSQAINPELSPKDTVRTLSDYITMCYNLNEIEAIGIGVPGIVDNQGLLKFSPNLPHWNNVDLTNLLSAYIKLPIFVENDANTAAIAELETGSGKDLNSFLYVTLGTGVGGSIILNRQVFRGDKGGAGEIGHTIINYLETDSFIKHQFRLGTLEEYIGRIQILANAKKNAQIHPESAINRFINFDVHDLSILADNGDRIAKEVISESGSIFGIGIASALNLLGIHNVIVGGGISQISDIFWNSANQVIKLRSLPSISENYKIIKARFLQNTGIIGAALFAKHQLSS